MKITELYDEVILAIIESVDYDLAKGLSPELAEDPEEAAETIAEARVAGYAKYLEIIEAPDEEDD